jgi:four helix bundle protein
MKVKSYEELVAWQKAMVLAKVVYSLQKQLPKEEMYGLGDQIRRAVISVPSNIAEGFGRDSATEFKRFLAIARGSLYELKTQLQLAECLGYLETGTEVMLLIDEVGKLINGLARSLVPSH